MKKKVVLMTVLFFGLGIILASCAGMQTKPTAANFKAPQISLEEFMVPQYDGYWYISSKTKPVKGKAGNRGAPLPMTFLFNVNNPNSYPVALEGIKFDVVFDKEFTMVTYNSEDTIWIPANKTTQVRTTTLITVRSGLLSLLVTGGYKLKARGWSPWQALERWWTGVPEFSVPVGVDQGAFTFMAGDVVKVLPFAAEVK